MTKRERYPHVRRNIALLAWQRFMRRHPPCSAKPWPSWASVG